MPDNLKLIGETIMPDFPRTKHLPYLPNASRDDLIASFEEAQVIFNPAYRVTVTEKVDGANIGVMFGYDNQILIRNRNHVLNKAKLAKGAATQQFTPCWSYFYRLRDSFIDLGRLLNQSFVIYGDWMYAVHSVTYEYLDVPFLAHHVYLPESRTFMESQHGLTVLDEVGFRAVPVIAKKVESYKQLQEWCNNKSIYGTVREGVYVTCSVDDTSLSHRFKMVRQDFIAGEHWSKKSITRQPSVKFRS
jgi:atypical dual specificity phosphatase